MAALKALVNTASLRYGKCKVVGLRMNVLLKLLKATLGAITDAHGKRP